MKRALLLLIAAACSDGPSAGDASIPDAGEAGAWRSAFDAEDLGWFLYAWGASADDLYAVGGTPAQGRIMHFDGSAWSAVQVGFSFPLLNWCYGFGSDDVTFVGAGGTVIHFDGAQFALQSTPTDQDLWGVWGATADDLWAVGGRGTARDQATILHFDGTAWTATATPALARPNVFAYYKVWGTGRDDVYAVGQRGALVRWDGARWSEIATEADDDLISLWGTGPDRIVAVGGRTNGQVIAFDGTSWRRRSLAPLPALNGVWTRSRDTFHLAGVQGTAVALDFDTLDYTLEDTDTFFALHGVFGIGDRLFAVGGTLLDVSPPHKGVALERSLGGAE